VLLLKRPNWATAARAVRDPLAELEELDRPELRVVVNRGGHLERVTRSLFHAAQIRAVDDNAGREALARGEADAAMTNTYEAPRWSTGLAGIEQLGPLTTDITALWVRADRGDLAERLDAWLLEAEHTGELARLRTRYLGAAAGGATASPVDALLAATAERLALMPLVAIAKKRAGTAVEDVKQEDRVLLAAREQVAKAAAKHGTPTPSAPLVDAFFRAQIEAAKVVQRRANDGEPSTSPTEFSLDHDLRPAIARIAERMSFLIVRVPRDLSATQVTTQAREDLRETGVDVEHIDGLAKAITALGTPDL
jgi:cyclohexadienyl dehydratase